MTNADVLSRSLRSPHRAASQLDHAVAEKLGLRWLDYEAVGHILYQDGAHLGPAELGHRLRISTGSATELADRLERSGHISRTREGADRRRVQLVAQQHAVGRILGELGPLCVDLDNLSQEFSAEEQVVIQQYLRGAGDRLRFHAATLSAATHVGDLPHRG